MKKKLANLIKEYGYSNYQVAKAMWQSEYGDSHEPTDDEIIAYLEANPHLKRFKDRKMAVYPSESHKDTWYVLENGKDKPVDLEKALKEYDPYDIYKYTVTYPIKKVRYTQISTLNPIRVPDDHVNCQLRAWIPKEHLKAIKTMHPSERGKALMSYFGE